MKRGRPPLDPKHKTLTVSVCLTDEQKARFMRLGGSKWLRERIEEAAPVVTKSKPNTWLGGLI